MGRKELLNQSRAKLADWLDSNEFEIVKASGKRWLLRRAEQDFYIEVTAHADGRQADYRICNKSWNPIQ